MNAAEHAGRGFDRAFARGAYDDADRRESELRAEFWRKVKRVAARVPFLDDLLAVYYCAMDRQTPMRVRGMLLGALAYFILPADAVPDVIVGLGFTDDAAVIATVVGLLGAHLKAKHRLAAAQALGKELPGGD